MRLRVSLVLIAMVFAAVTAGQASAAKPGGGSNGGSCSSPTLTGPFEAHVGDSYTLDGCGFSPGSIVPLEIAEAGGCCIALNQVADQYGKFSYTGSVWATGTYRVRASVARNGSGRWRVAASWSFEAYP
jgi:hypothetical protein